MLSVVVFGSCESFVNLDPPKNQLATETVFSDSLGARGALKGIYIDIMEGGGLASGALSIYTGLSADELIYSSSSGYEHQFYLNEVAVNNSINSSSFWTKTYKFIYATNAIMEGVQASEGISFTAKESIIAEARLVRGLCYFYLANLYGAIPLVMSTDYNINRRLERSSQGEAYAFAEEDLTYARDYLQSTVVLNTHATKFAAEALLAKVFLYQGKYDLALDASTKVIASRYFSLEEELADVFLANSKEAIWKLSPVSTHAETWEGYYFIPRSQSSLPNFIISPTLYGSFEAGDKRKIAWIATSRIQDNDYHYPFKYKERAPAAKEEYSMMRLAELYLIRAEANAKLNYVQASVADLNVIRTRAGLTEYTFQNQEALLLAIEKERQVELFCEWGNRWFDLIRTGRAMTVLSTVKPGWKGSAEHYPIPQPELDSNPNLTQNEGY